MGALAISIGDFLRQNIILSEYLLNTRLYVSSCYGLQGSYTALNE